MNQPSQQSSGTIAAVREATTWGQIIRRYTTAIGYFAVVTGIGIAQLTEGWAALKAWRAAAGLYPVLIAIGFGIVVVAITRMGQLLFGITAAITALTAQDGKLIEQDRKHDEAIAELSQRMKRIEDRTGEHALQGASER